MTNYGDILVLGLGRSGVAAAVYSCDLVSRGRARSVTVLDAASSQHTKSAAEQLRVLGATVELGVNRVDGAYDLCIASPGIPPHAPIMVSALSVVDRVISEIEFAFLESSQPWIAITGTNGKTTTTALTSHLLEAGGISVRTVGNIGAPAITAVAEAGEDEVFVAEVSSFQLSLTHAFHPQVAILLNLTPDHIDYHGSLEAYAADKMRVFANLTDENLAIIDMDDPGSAAQVASVAERGVPVVRVSLSDRHALGATVADGALVLETRGGEVRLCRAGQLLIKGAHNVSNALAAAAAAHAFGVSVSDLRSGLISFRAIEHRLEPAGCVDGVEWFNDSKATNPDAVFKAIDAFDGQSLILLLGGRNKGNDFRPLAEKAAHTAKSVVVFGESRIELASAFEGLAVPVLEAVSLVDAVGAARQLSDAGDVIVLSPACASFDEFTSYEHRGEVFKSLVRDLEVTSA
jgi:UDP-N-acetylmuramoylalanine--D-glutamate ligase